MKLFKIASSSLAAFFYVGSAHAGFLPVPEPSLIGLISFGVVAVFVATRFKK